MRYQRLSFYCLNKQCYCEAQIHCCAADQCRPPESWRQCADQRAEKRDGLLGVDSEKMSDAKIAARAIPPEQGRMSADETHGMAGLLRHIDAESAAENTAHDETQHDRCCIRRMQAGCGSTPYFPGQWQHGGNQRYRTQTHESVHDLVKGARFIEVGCESMAGLPRDINDLEAARGDDDRDDGPQDRRLAS